MKLRTGVVTCIVTGSLLAGAPQAFAQRGDTTPPPVTPITPVTPVPPVTPVSPTHNNPTTNVSTSDPVSQTGAEMIMLFGMGGSLAGAGFMLYRKGR